MLWRWQKTFYGCAVVVVFVMFTYFFLVEDKDPNNGIARRNPHHESGLFVEKIVAYAEDFFNQVADYPCKNLSKRDIASVEYVNDLWQKSSDSSMYLFSAYYDNRYKSSAGLIYHFVRVILSNLGTLDIPVYCQVWYANRSHPLVVQSDVQEIWSKIWDKSSKNLYYKPYLVSCPIPKSYRDTGVLPIGISVSNTPCAASGTFLQLAKPGTKKKKNFAVCVKGLDFLDDISFKIVEWIETQLLLGADSLTIYIFQVHPNVLKVLKYYESMRKVTLKNLTLPGRQPNLPASARSEYLKKNQWQKRRHELVPYNDCFYSYIYSHKLVALVDLDEVIVPVVYPSWDKLFSVIVKNQGNVLEKYASFSVQNVYFFDDFGPSNIPEVPEYHHLLRYIHRSSNFSKPGYAVKSFLSTNSTLMAFNHYALTTLYSSVRRSALVSTEMARLHHYRKGCPNGMKNDCDSNFMKYTTKDTTIYKWKEKLIENTRNALKKLGFLPVTQNGQSI